MEVCDCAGIEQLLQSLEQLEQGDLQQEKAEDLVFLRGMLKTPEFHSLLKVKPHLLPIRLSLSGISPLVD